MGDGSSNILNKDSIQDFNGNYGFGDTNTNFPATAFVLNPPYSAQGNGMIFVKKAFEMMHSGYASIIIQNSAGSGKVKDINKEILKRNTLIASIKMPSDLFIGKSSVQTNIYVFKIGERHEKDEQVKFAKRFPPKEKSQRNANHYGAFVGGVKSLFKFDLNPKTMRQNRLFKARFS